MFSLSIQVDQVPLPLLFMRTVIQAIDAFPTLVSFNFIQFIRIWVLNHVPFLVKNLSGVFNLFLDVFASLTFWV